MSYVAIDTETTGLEWEDEPFLISYAGDMVEPADQQWASVIDVADERAMEALRWQYVDIKSITFIMHNSKFDRRMLAKVGIDIPWDRIHDTHLMAHLLNENRDNKLKSLAKTVLGMTTDEAEEMTAARRRVAKLLGTRKFTEIPYNVVYQHEPEVVTRYAEMDARMTLALFKVLWPAIQVDDGLLSLYNREMYRLYRVVARTEADGMKVHREFVQQKIKELGSQVVAYTGQLEELTYPGFKPRSEPQLRKVLSERGHNPKNTQAATLRALDDEVANLVLEVRRITKLRSTYLMNMFTLSDNPEAVMHPNFNVNVSTGRMSSRKETK